MELSALQLDAKDCDDLLPVTSQSIGQGQSRMLTGLETIRGWS